MKDRQDPHGEQYQRARSAFEELSIEERTLFLIKETIHTIAAGVDDAVDKLSAEFETLFREARGNGAHEDPAEEAAPPKAKKTSTRKKSTATRAKTTKKKTTTRKPRAKKKDDDTDTA